MKANDVFAKQSKPANREGSKLSKKEHGISREVMNSISLYIYNRNYKPMPNAFDIYNDWTDNCGVYPMSLEGLIIIIEFIRKVSNLDRDEMEKALEYDHFL